MKISIRLSEKIHFIAGTRHFNDIHIDEPKSFHGTDLGPSSVEYVLIGIGGCLGSTLAFCLKKYEIEIDDLEITIDGTLSHSGPLKRLRLIKVDANLFLTTKNTDNPKKIEDCINNFKDHCVVSNSIINGLPIDVNVIHE